MRFLSTTTMANDVAKYNNKANDVAKHKNNANEAPNKRMMENKVAKHMHNGK